eukprot:6672114-Karenia_brevis.AAC.1
MQERPRVAGFLDKASTAASSAWQAVLRGKKGTAVEPPVVQFGVVGDAEHETAPLDDTAVAELRG